MEHPAESHDDLEALTIPNRRKGRLGRYSLHYLLGRGGMASVYLSRLVVEGGFERWVAVKVMHEHLADNPVVRKMFLDEARTAARLQHANLVQVTDFGMEDDLPYLVMEYIDGETLSALLRRCIRSGTPLPFPLAARIMAWSCDGLHHAHELKGPGHEPLNLVHRDVSPQNILISYNGVAKVTDFGIAKVANQSVRTRTGQTKGKTAYMAPEQIFGDTLDRRTDVFALGIVLYEATTGRRLFRSDNEFETLRRITSGEVPPPSGLVEKYPQEIEEIVLKALQVKPAERYQTAREMQRDLELYLAHIGEPTGTVEVGEFMESLFQDRIKIRREKLLAIPTEDLDYPLVISEISPTPGTLTSGSMRLVTGVRSRRVVIIITALLALCVVGLLLWAFVGGGDDDGTDRPPAQGGVADVAPSRPTDEGAVVPDVPSPIVTPIREPDASTTTERDAETGGEGERPRPPPVVPAVAKQPGTLSIITAPWCDVYLGGKRLGRTPMVSHQVPSGRHSLRLLPLGKQPAVRRTVVVRPGQNTPININLLD